VKIFYHSVPVGVVIGIAWTMVAATTAAVLMSFATGESFRPGLWGCLLFGLLLGQLAIYLKSRWLSLTLALILGLIFMHLPFSPVISGASSSLLLQWLAALLFGAMTIVPLQKMLEEIVPGAMTRHIFEEAVIRFLTGVGYVVFTAIVLIPFYVMVMTSLKSQQALLQNPLDFSIDLSRGTALAVSLRSLPLDQFLHIRIDSTDYTCVFCSRCLRRRSIEFSWTSCIFSVDTTHLYGSNDRARATDLHCLFRNGSAQYGYWYCADLSSYDNSRCLVHAAGLLPWTAGRGGKT